MSIHRPSNSHQTPRATLPARCRHGLTLMETALVLAIVLILAGVAIPTFDMTVADAKVASVQQTLQRVRTAIDYFRFQHQELLPGHDNVLDDWTEAAFLAQLSGATNLAGDTAPAGTAGYPYGPYLMEKIPACPYNSLSSVVVVAPGESTSLYPDDSSGWVYFAVDGTFKANTTAKTHDGVPIFDF